MKKHILFILLLMILVPSFSCAAEKTPDSRVQIRIFADGKRYDLRQHTQHYQDKDIKGDGHPSSTIMYTKADSIRLSKAPDDFRYIALFDSTLKETSTSGPLLLEINDTGNYQQKTVSASDIAALGDGAWPIVILSGYRISEEEIGYSGYSIVWLLIGEEAVIPEHPARKRLRQKNNAD